MDVHTMYTVYTVYTMYTVHWTAASLLCTLYIAPAILCTVGRVENGNQSVFKNLLAFFAAIWYID